ncbi:MAG: DUF454 family protein [Lachnospiraceae bacterium]|nr:DUF454 family protein [Lachnospiraceae bacterium]
MKKICFLILGIAFLILGIIGLALPIIPQIPFLVLGACLLIMSSKKIKDFVLNHRMYHTHVEPHIKKSKTMSRIWERFSGDDSSDAKSDS